MFQFRGCLLQCIIIFTAFCQLNRALQEQFDEMPRTITDYLLKEELTRFVLSPMLNKLKEVERKLEEIKTSTCNQDVEQANADAIHYLGQQVLEQTSNLTNIFQQLTTKQDSIIQNLTNYSLQLDLFFEATKPNFGPVLISAVESADTKRVLALLELGAPIESHDSEKNRPIHKAVENLDTDILKILLDHGADANCHGQYGYTPLHWTSYNGCLECARILLEKGAFVDSRDNWEDTPLIKSAKYGYDDLVKLLLANGADINAVQEAHYSALHMAARDGRISTVAILVRHGADLSLKTKTKYTALDFAIENKHYEIESFLKNEMPKNKSKSG